MRNRLTERDLSRIVRRVINEEGEVVKTDPCKQKINELRNAYKRVIDKMDEYSSLEWWEWYDKMNLSMTPDEIREYAEYLKEEVRILRDCKIEEMKKNKNIR